MMNNQNASGTENVSDNNSLNPQINPGNINSSERPNINSILNGENNTDVNGGQGEINSAVPVIESIPQSVPVQTSTTVNPSMSDNSTVVPTVESIPQGEPQVVNTSIQTPTTVNPSMSNNSTIVPTVESIPQSEPQVVNTSIQTPTTVNPSINDNSTVVPTVESIPQSEPQVVNTSVQTPLPVADSSINNTNNNSTSVESNQSGSINNQVDLNNPAVNQMNGMANAVNSTVYENQTPPASNNDEFNAIPQPPVFEEEPKKKAKAKFDKKILIIILIVILIAAIGFGVYYFLTSAKSSAANSIITNDLKFELGQTLSQDINDYAKITGFKKENCTLDLSNVSTTRVSTYKYYVTCGNEKKEGTVIVDDTTVPQLVLNDLVVLPNAQIKPEDFVEQCIDASNCTLKFNGDYQTITKEVGEYDIEIEASDDFNNKTVLKTKLNVTLNAPVKYMTCTSKEKSLENDEVRFVDSYKIGIDANNNFLNATRISQFNYKNETSYERATQNYEKSIGINNIIGTENFLPSSKTITLKSNKDLKGIENDLNGTLNKNMSLFTIYIEGYGYTCK